MQFCSVWDLVFSHFRPLVLENPPEWTLVNNLEHLLQCLSDWLSKAEKYKHLPHLQTHGVLKEPPLVQFCLGLMNDVIWPFFGLLLGLAGPGSTPECILISALAHFIL